MLKNPFKKSFEKFFENVKIIIFIVLKSPYQSKLGMEKQAIYFSVIKCTVVTLFLKHFDKDF